MMNGIAENAIPFLCNSLYYKLTLRGKRLYNNTYLRKEGKKMNYHEKEPQFIKKQPSKLREHFQRGMTTLLVIIAGVLFFFAVWRFDELAAVVGKVFDVLMPIIYGLVIAFLLNPIVKRVEKFLSPRLNKVIKKEQTVHRISRSIGVIVSFIIAITVITALFNMLIPELYKSIYDLVVALPSHIDALGARANEFLHEDTFLGKTLKSVLLESGEALEKWFLDWVQNDLLRHVSHSSGHSLHSFVVVLKYIPSEHFLQYPSVELTQPFSVTICLQCLH